MSLDYNFSEVQDYENVCWINGEFNPVTNALILDTMIVGIHNITKENWMEFYARISMWETAFGPLLVSQEGPVYLDPLDVQKHIGLRTNAVDMTSTKFKNHFFQEFHNDKLNLAKKAGLNV